MNALTNLIQFIKKVFNNLSIIKKQRPIHSSKINNFKKEPVMSQPDIKEFNIIKNDLNITDIAVMKDLIKLKCLYSTQLPKMHREYIVKLLFDSYHSSLILKINNTLVAGLTFRGFKDKSFLQIAFLSVNNQNRFQGLGSKLMDQFKRYCQNQKKTHVFTFADNTAIQFFQKHSFTKEITLPEYHYKQFIKQYVGGKLMECQIQENVNYQHLKQGISYSKKCIFQRLRELTVCQTPYDLKQASEIIKSKQNKILADLLIFIPGFSQSSFKKENFQQNKKMNVDFLISCQNFIELVYQKRFLLQNSSMEQQTQKNRFKEFIKLIKMLEAKLFKGQFQYTDPFISEFNQKLQKIINSNETLNYEQKMFLQKIEKIKYEFKKNMILPTLKQKKIKLNFCKEKEVQQKTN